MKEVLEAKTNSFSSGLPVVQLPSDRPRTAAMTYKLGHCSFVLTKTLTEALETLSQQEGIDLFVTLLAAFKILIHRYTEQEDILVGTRIVNRNQTQPNEQIGIEGNPVAVRTYVSGELSFREFLLRVSQATQEAGDRLAQPEKKRTEQQQLEPNLTHHFECQVMFTLQNDPMPVVESADLTQEHVEDTNGTLKLELNLSMVKLELGLKGVLEYNAALFDAATIERMSGHFQTLLSGIVDNSKRNISELPLLTETELHQLLMEWNGTQVDYPKDLCIHQVFETQVAQTPDSTAVVFEQQKLTYQDLNCRANQLARYLQKLGVEPEVRVGVCIHPGIETAVALLGILKAGGVYVPLDPTYPKERLTFMLEDSQVSVLLAQKAIVKDLPACSQSVICLDENWEDISHFDGHNLDNPTSWSDAAYIIYTSGTTGKPKGVVAEQGNLTNYILATQALFEFDNQDVMPCMARLSFSISLFELLSCLVSGGTTIILKREQVLDLNRLVKIFERVTNIHTVPTLMDKIVRVIKNQSSLETINYQNIKRIFLGGERVTPELLESVKAVFPDSQISVLYGCSEVSTLCSSYRVPRDGKVEKSIIGRSLNNVSLRLYDKHLNLLPIGVTGEIYVGGKGITRGYLNREDLTKEKYITIDNQRFFRTGDLGRYLPDGNIEFFGRKDYQVKLRGMRLELGEIEQVLGQNSSVQQSVVKVWKDVTGEKHLVAYVVPHPEAPPTISELRYFLKQKLPDYMVPSYFVLLSTLPLNANGKVDRQALPDPDIAKQELEETFVPPRNELERKLEEIWQEVLGVNPISIRSNFFELGGNSLRAAQVISRVSEDFFIELSLEDLFEAPTIASLAQSIEVLRWATQDKNTSIEGEDSYEEGRL
jgi:amino acid adenylation domain-containing protein